MAIDVRKAPRLPRQCSNEDGTPKIEYPTRTAARHAERRIAREDGVRLEAYQCGSCSKWHLGHRRDQTEPVRLVRIQRQRRRGWLMPEGATYVGRPSAWGNPAVIGRPTGTPGERWTQESAVAYFRDVYVPKRLATDPTWLEPLRHATALVCWCRASEVCHGDVLIEFLSR